MKSEFQENIKGVGEAFGQQPIIYWIGNTYKGGRKLHSLEFIINPNSTEDRIVGRDEDGNVMLYFPESTCQLYYY